MDKRNITIIGACAVVIILILVTAFVLNDGLNHLFIESEGPYAGTTAEYNGHGSVDSGVVDDIAGFILNRS